MNNKIIFATHNKHKLQEVREMLKPLNIEVVGADEINMPDVEETGSTFEENAILKAIAGVKSTGLPVIAEDAGISIEALNGQPGIYSARFAQQHGGFPKVFEYLNQQLKNSENRNAFYTSVFVVAYSETNYHIFKGFMHGKLAQNPSGTNGFGYDPLFIPEGFDTTLGNIPSEVKNKISHRSKSLKQVYEFLNQK